MSKLRDKVNDVLADMEYCELLEVLELSLEDIIDARIEALKENEIKAIAAKLL